MANIPSSPVWSPEVTQIETTDAVLGGPDGVINVQAKQLADRTAFLKQQVETAASVAGSAEDKAAQALAQIDAIEIATESASDSAAAALLHKQAAEAAQALAELARNDAQDARADAAAAATGAAAERVLAWEKAAESRADASTALLAASQAVSIRNEVAGIGDAKKAEIVSAAQTGQAAIENASAVGLAAVETAAADGLTSLQSTEQAALAQMIPARDAAIAASQTATTKASEATSAATTATTQAATATTQAGLSTTAKNAAETARDAAFVNANVYADTASGLAATTSGQQFQVVSGGEIIRYKNNSGSAVEVARYPKGGFRRYLGEAVPATSPEATTNNYYLAQTPGTYTNFGGLVVGNEIANLRYNGSSWVKETILSFMQPKFTFGKVISGYIHLVSNNSGTYTVVVGPGTVVEMRSGVIKYNGQKYGYAELPVTAGTFTITADGNPSPGSAGLAVTLTGSIVFVSDVYPQTSEVCMIAYCYNWGGVFKNILPSNHWFASNGIYMSLDNNQSEFNVKKYGATGNGTTDDSTAIYYAGRAATAVASSRAGINNAYEFKKSNTRLYFPKGTYIVTSGMGGNFQNVRFIGDNKTDSILKASNAGAVNINLAEAEDITFENIFLGAYTWTTWDLFYYKNVKFIWDGAYTNGSTYLISCSGVNNEIVGCDFDYRGNVYIPLRFNGYRSVRVENCVFNPSGTGYASHAMRINPPGFTKHNIVIRQNKVYSGTTGIFFGSDRTMPISNVIVESNELVGQIEESISFDGFGNNSGLCPVICNGLITSATNDANGRLVITAAMKYHNGSTPNVDCPVSTRADWTNYFFSLDEGSGREGTVTRIVSADSATNAFTLETRTPASAIAAGGWCGVQAGFFDCAVRNNLIVGSVGNAPNFNYATALSIYLNVFNFTIDGNTIVGCANGINLAGGLMLSTYRTLAYNNVVKNNRFLSCNERAGDAVVRFESYYGTVKQYNNQFINNVIQGGKVGVYMRHQANLIYENNVVDHVDAFDWKYCGNTLPTANATQIGRTFMKIIDDGSGNPTTIEYYVCKLSGGAYTWVAV